MKNHSHPLSAAAGDQNQLALTAKRLAAIVEASDDAIIGEDLKGIITDWNPGAERIFGYRADEIIGTAMTRLVPADQQQEYSSILEKIRRGEKVDRFESLRQAKNGQAIQATVTALPITDEEGNIIGATKIVRDMTLRKEHEWELSRMTRLYSALSHINEAIAWTATREELFQKICDVLVKHGGFYMAWVGWHDPETRRILPAAVAGKEPNYPYTVQVYGDDRLEGRGPAGQAFRTGKPYICNDVRHHPATLPWREQMAQCGFESSSGFPILIKNEVRGVLMVYSEEPRFFQDKEITLLNEAACEISFALDSFAEKEVRLEVERVAANERLFSATMIESMPGILYFFDVQGRFQRWNRNFETVSGYSAEEVARMHPLDFSLEGEKELVKQRITEVFTHGESSVESSFVTKDGRALPYFLTGRRVVFNGKTCLVGVGVDISERKRADLELRETQAQLEAVVENLREGLVMADPTGGFLRWNPASLRMLGFTDLEEGRRRQREFAGIFELFTLEGAQLPYEQWPLARVRRGDVIDNFELRVRRMGENWERIFSYSGTVVRLAGEKDLAFMTMQDITERKRAELTLRVLNQTLEQEVAERTSDLQAALLRAEAADRLKSAFLATMSHELRTPLNSIIGFTGIVLQGLAGPLNAEQIKQLGMVRGSARHLLELINDVLDLSKIEAGQLEVRTGTFNLSEAIAHVTGLVKPLAEKNGLTLEMNVPPGLNEVNNDRRRVEQILLNLINNAIKFTERGGVKITAERVADYQPSPGAASLPAVRVRVADTGIGIRPEDLATLFQPFRQIDAGLARQHEGTGLGLTICRRLASLLGGEISVTSEWTKGSEFTLTLPSPKRAIR